MEDYRVQRHEAISKEASPWLCSQARDKRSSESPLSSGRASFGSRPFGDHAISLCGQTSYFIATVYLAWRPLSLIGMGRTPTWSDRRPLRISSCPRALSGLHLHCIWNLNKSRTTKSQRDKEAIAGHAEDSEASAQKAAYGAWKPFGNASAVLSLISRADVAVFLGALGLDLLETPCTRPHVRLSCGLLGHNPTSSNDIIASDLVGESMELLLVLLGSQQLGFLCFGQHRSMSVGLLVHCLRGGNVNVLVTMAILVAQNTVHVWFCMGGWS